MTSDEKFRITTVLLESSKTQLKIISILTRVTYKVAPQDEQLKKDLQDLMRSFEEQMEAIGKAISG